MDIYGYPTCYRECMIEARNYLSGGYSATALSLYGRALRLAEGGFAVGYRRTLQRQAATIRIRQWLLSREGY